jgi:2Fe-2S ferredoxin
MPRVTFLLAAGGQLSVEAQTGLSLMETAKDHGVGGILALCGGACACATCHVYVDSAWRDRLPPAEEIEDAMLELAWERRSGSRLSCQIAIGPRLDGLVVTVPARQAVV